MKRKYFVLFLVLIFVVLCLFEEGVLRIAPNTIRIRDDVDLSELEVITPKNVHRLELISQWGKGNVYGVDLSPDGHTIAVGTNTGTYLYDSKTGQQIGFIDLSLALNTLNRLECGFGRDGIAFSPDGKYLAVAELDIRIWDLETDSLYRTIRSPGLGKKWVATDLQFGPDGQQVAVSWVRRDFSHVCQTGKGIFSIYNVDNGKQNFSQEFLRYFFNYESDLVEPGIAYFHGRLQEETTNTSLVAVDIATGEKLERKVIELGDFYEFSPDGNMLVNYETNYQERNSPETASLIDLETGSQVGEYSYFVTPLPQSDNLLAYRDDAWQIQNQDEEVICQFVFHVMGDDFPAFENEFPAFNDMWLSRVGYEAATGNIQALIFDQNGKLGISYGWGSEKVWLWDLEECSVSDSALLLPASARNLALVFSDDGLTLFAGKYGNKYYAWNVATGTAQLKYGIGRLNNTLQEPVVSFDGQLEALEFKPFVLIKDAKNGAGLGIVESPGPHYGLPMAFSPDGHLFVVMGYDGIINVWGVRKD